MMMGGNILKGRYLLREQIGSGGAGVVYRGEDLNLDGAPIAVKVLHPHLIGIPEVRARFEQDAFLAARIQHENIVQVHELVSEGNILAIVMAYVGDGSLDRWMAGYGRPLPFELFYPIFEQVLRGVQAAHEHGIVHRDLKPSNILLADRGDRWVAKVTDFGIARAHGGKKGLTRMGGFVGTVHYSAPEQTLNAANVDQRADIYSLGIILYEALTGRKPFDGDSDVSIMQQHIDPDCHPPLPVDLVPAIGAELQRIVLTAMARAPEARFQTVRDLRQACDAHLQETPPPVLGPFNATSIEAAPLASKQVPGPRAPSFSSPPPVNVNPAIPKPPPRFWTHGRIPAAAAAGLLCTAIGVLLIRDKVLPRQTPPQKPAVDAPVVATPSVAVVPPAPASDLPVTKKVVPAESPTETEPHPTTFPAKQDEIRDAESGLPDRQQHDIARYKERTARALAEKIGGKGVVEVKESSTAGQYNATVRWSTPPRLIVSSRIFKESGEDGQAKAIGAIGFMKALAETVQPICENARSAGFRINRVTVRFDSGIVFRFSVSQVTPLLDNPAGLYEKLHFME